jgi:hypothetical protein
LSAPSFSAARARPAFALYLLAIATLGFKWLSPLSFFYERAEWCDVFVAAAAVAWGLEWVRRPRMPSLRPFHLFLGLYVLLAAASMVAAGATGTGLRNVLLIVELAVLALLSADFASEREGRQAIILVVAGVSLFTAALTAAGLALFYAGVDTGLLGGYGQLEESDLYTRVAAGFESPGLLSSFCIFASALVAHEDSPLSTRQRRVVQAALAFTVLCSLSRGIVAFAVAWALRVRPRAAVPVLVGGVALFALMLAADREFDPGRPQDVSLSVAPDDGTRRHLVKESAETAAEHPFLGQGPGTLVHRGELRAHVTPLNVAATLGIPALLAMTLMVVALWRGRRRPTPVATWSGLAGLGIDGLGQDVEHFRHLWVLLGFADAERSGANSPVRNAPWRPSRRLATRPSRGGSG